MQRKQSISINEEIKCNVFNWFLAIVAYLLLLFAFVLMLRVAVELDDVIDVSVSPHEHESRFS